MVAKSVDSDVAGMNTLLTSTPDTFGKSSGLAQSPTFRDCRPSSLVFDAELHDGKVRTAGSPVGQDMAKKLNQLCNHYRPDLDYVAKERGLRILDKHRSVFHIQSTPGASAVLKSSRTLMAHPTLLTSPGRAHLGQISGIQTTAEGSQFRLIRQHLHRFEPLTLSWMAEKDAQKYSRLGLTSEGVLMKVPLGLCDRSIDGKAQVSLEQSVGGACLRFQPSGEAASLCFTPVSEAGEALQLTRIGLAGEVLYASSPEGELLRGDLRSVADGCLRMCHEPAGNLERWLGGAVSFQGFMHDDDGQLNALLIDRHQQLHSCPLTDRPCLLPDWNLSDVLLNVIGKGIPEPGLHVTAGAVDLGHRGKVALEGGTLLSWDSSAQHWDHTGPLDVDHLERGLDGFAYVLQAGQLKAVGTTKDPVRVSMGARHDLAPPTIAGPRVTLSDGLAGDTQRLITGFAVQDGRHFVCLDHTNQLRAHIDGKETVLAFSEPKDIQALALDHLGNLYAQSRAGELLTLGKADWQSPSSSTMAWETVPLPGNERLKSLRMGADKQLIVSWGENNAQLHRWGEKYRQLNISASGGMQWEAVDLPTRKNAAPLPARLRQGEVKGETGSTSWAVTNTFLGQKTEGVERSHGLLKGVRAHIQPIEGIKSVGRDIQHRVKGRKGLEKLYDADKALRAQLEPLANSKPAPLDMKTRLDLLSGRERTHLVATALKTALARVEENSRLSATKLGELHGVQVTPEATAPGASRDKNVPILSQMRQAFENLSPSTSNMTAALLRSYEAQHVSLSKWNADRTRDVSNPTALVESDLIHDAQTLSQLSQMITDLEGGSLDRVHIGAALEALMQSYDANPVHKKVSQNIHGYAQAEALYNNFKLLAKDLGTPGSALNFHIARTLGLAAEGSVEQALMQEIQQSETGYSLTPSRDKSKGVGLLVDGIAVIPFLDFAVGVSRAKANAVTITRTDKGANIEIKTNTTHGIKGVVGVGKTLAPLSGSWGGGVRALGEVAASYARDKGASINFNVKQADFSKMMKLLTGEEGDVYDLLDIGTEHACGESVKDSIDLGILGLVQGRGHFKVEDGSGALESLVRGVAGGGFNLNVGHWENSRSVTQGQNQTTTTRTQGSGLQLFNKGGASVGVGPFNSRTEVEPGGSKVAAFTACETTLSISFDRTKTHAFIFTFKQPSLVDQAHVSVLTRAMSLLSAPLRAGLQARSHVEAGIGEQLHTLERLFDNAPVPPTRTEEHFALSKQLQDLVQQHRLASQGKRALSSIESTVTSVGLKNDAQHTWMDDAAPANKKAIVELIKKQPQLAQMLEDLKSSKGTSTSIRLEIKPAVLREIEASMTAGQSVRGDVERALKNPDNLRIKSMNVSYKTSRTHGIGLSLPGFNFSSTAGLSHAHNVFNTVFEYGKDPNVPVAMTRNRLSLK